MQQDWKEAWQDSVRRQDEALERSRRVQAEIEACFRRKEAPSRQLLRVADAVASELAAAKARVSELLRMARTA